MYFVLVLLERFVVLLHKRTRNQMRVKDARKHLFSQTSRTLSREYFTDSSSIDVANQASHVSSKNLKPGFCFQIHSFEFFQLRMEAK